MRAQSILGMVLLILLGMSPAAAVADAPVSLRENFPVDYQYRVSVRVELDGSLTVPDPKAAAGKPVRIRGQSAIEYDERVLQADKDSGTTKTIRQYRQLDFQRTVDGQPQTSTLRPEVRRLVILRHEQAEVPFSPEGPLTWAEIDLVRTDVFTPALVGLLPAREARVGDRWQAADAAVRELTDLERIDDGKLDCQLEQLTTVNNRRYARITFRGVVRGINEDGPNRQHLEGHYFFDLESHHLSYLTLQGTSTLHGKDGKALGQVAGRFVLTRQAHVQARELAAESLRGVNLEPNDDNTLLLYDNTDLKIRLLHPRAWRVAHVRGAQLTLEAPGGNGLLLTVEPASRLPSAAQYLAETREYFQKQKARHHQAEGPRKIQAVPHELDHFALEVESDGQPVWMDYYVTRQPNGGATLAARLAEAQRPRLRHEVERIARSVTVGVK